MHLIRSILSRFLGASPSTPPADPERAVERLVEDEALRGALTDAGYAPLLDVVTRLVVARAARFDSTDALHRAARDLLAGAVAAAENADAAPLLAAARPPFIWGGERQELAGALRALAAPGDEAAEAIARALAEATGARHEQDGGDVES